jgi:hypothetical protein
MKLPEKKVAYGPLPNCDLCDAAGLVRKAKYDMRTRMGPWGHLCTACALDFGVNAELGTNIVDESDEAVREFNLSKGFDVYE